MSGGHWKDSGRIETDLNSIADDDIVERRWPRLSEMLRELGRELGKMECDMDWDISGDHYIENDGMWEDNVTLEILHIAVKYARDSRKSKMNA